MNRTQYVDTLEGFSLGTVVGSHLEPTMDRDIPLGDPRLANPFEDFEATYPMKPCVSFKITPEMVAADAAERAERERQHRASVTWIPPVAASRAEPKPQLTLSQPRPEQRERVASASRRNGVVRGQQGHNLATACTGCGHPMKSASKSGMCAHCKTYGTPAELEAKQAIATLPAAVPVTELDEQPAASSQQPAASSQQPAAKPRSSRTPLSSEKRSAFGGGEVNRDERTWFEEAELDALWNALSVNDKWALLEEAI